MKYKPGDIFPTTVMEAVIGEAINIPDRNCLVHLQFRRFVDCPICNTHIAEFRKRARDIESAGIKEVIVFHSSPKSIRSYQKDVPFLIVGDPKKVLYKEFGVETSLGFASPKALGAAMRGIVHGHFGLRLAGGPLGLPADFMIAPSGRIYPVKYGAHAFDQWSVEELLTLANRPRRSCYLKRNTTSLHEARKAKPGAKSLAAGCVCIAARADAGRAHPPVTLQRTLPALSGGYLGPNGVGARHDQACAR